MKRRFEILIGRYTANPMMRGMFKLGITPPGMALVETIGRRTGTVRHTPVAYTPEGETLWLAGFDTLAGAERAALALTPPQVPLQVWLHGRGVGRDGRSIRLRSASIALASRTTSARPFAPGSGRITGR